MHFLLYGQEQKDSLGSIISHSVHESPFEISRTSMYLHLPDSLGGRNTSGLTAIQLYINSSSKIDSFHIIKLKTIINGKTKIDFGIGMDMTSDVKRFNPFLSRYLERCVKVSQVKNTKVDTTTLMTLIVRFK